MVRVAGALSLLLACGFGIPAVLGLIHFAKHHEVWTLFGFPAYGKGPFEGIGIETSIPLLAGFIIVCVAEAVVGIMLLIGAPHAAAASYLLLPFEAAYWVGFALPFGPPLGLARTALLLLA